MSTYIAAPDAVERAIALGGVMLPLGARERNSRIDAYLESDQRAEDYLVLLRGHRAAQARRDGYYRRTLRDVAQALVSGDLAGYLDGADDLDLDPGLVEVSWVEPRRPARPPVDPVTGRMVGVA
jgi:hypothetical protein